MTDRCHDCDLPLATQADVCVRTPVDWRARALAAEARVVEIEADRVRLDCVDDLRTIT